MDLRGKLRRLWLTLTIIFGTLTLGSQAIHEYIRLATIPSKKKKRLATIILPPFVLVVNLKLQRSSLTINSIYFFNTLSSEKEKTNKICSNSLSLSKREIPPPNSTFVVTDELHRGCNKIIISALEHHFWIHRLHIFIISLQTDMQPRNLEVSFPQSLYSPPTLCACIINDIAQWA